MLHPGVALDGGHRYTRQLARLLARIRCGAVLAKKLDALLLGMIWRDQAGVFSDFTVDYGSNYSLQLPAE